MEDFSNRKNRCCGCEACVQICPKGAIKMYEDSEGFRYPRIDKSKCINCKLCDKICQYNNDIIKHAESQYSFGGYIKDWNVRKESTSGGAFSAIVEAFCDNNYVIFGAAANAFNVYHTYVEDKNDIGIFRKSKYSQSKINNSYKDVKKFLLDGKKVLFSGTPCQIAALNIFLAKVDTKKLLTVEVVCEGVPSPLYIRKLKDYLENKHNARIVNIDYRYKDPKKNDKAKWDFQVMKIEFENGKSIKCDRWFNPYWDLWLKHLMSRPSCYSCKYTTRNRVADITLGDLWGVHIYCPELYGKNGGSSLAVANSAKGKKFLKKAEEYMYGHELNMDDILKYQSPMRKCISDNLLREKFMSDIKNKKYNYKYIINKWYNKPNFKLLFSKYIWGNRQKVFMINLKKSIRKKDI